jgi:broad specificity phosphatase PhoE
VLGLPVTVDPIVRERYAYACDIGSPRPALERDWPTLDFALIQDIWWPAEEEPESSIVDRAAQFRATLAAREDWAHTLVVCHWGFILSLTGQRVANGQWLRCDPTNPPPESLQWHA